MLIFGIVGYLMRKFRYEAPLGPCFGPGADDGRGLARTPLLMSAGSPVIFFQRPISAALMLISLFLLASAVLPGLIKKRKKIALNVEE